MRRQFIMAVLISMLAAPAHTKELSGVSMPDTLSVGGKTLKLNGLGLRKKAIFKVYVGGLYMESPSGDAAAILGSSQAKAVRMHFLRDLSKQQLTDAFKEGFEANAKAKAAVQKANIDKFLSMISDIKEGEELTFSFVADTGLTVSKGDKQTGVIEAKDFGDVLFAVWLGPAPPTEDLKKGMLGK
jgi:hypothetical protein